VKYKLYLILLITITSLSCERDSSYDCIDLPDPYYSIETKGNKRVRKIDIKVKYSNEQKNCGDSSLISSFKYDENGNLTEHVEQGKIKNKWSFNYDHFGNLIEETSLSDDSKRIWRYKYDLKGNKIQGSFITKNNSTLINYSYDSLNNLVLKSEISSSILNGKKRNSNKLTIFKINNLGEKIEEIEFYDDTIQSRIIFDYDTKGNLIESSYFNKTGELNKKLTLRYNNLNQVILDSITKGKSYSSFGIYFPYESIYDKNGNIIEKNIFDDLTYKLREKYFYQYDELGNLVQEISEKLTVENHILFSRNQKKELKSTKYSNDRNGNWVLKTVYLNGLPQYEIERNIDYFDKSTFKNKITKEINNNQIDIDYFDDKKRIYINNEFSFSCKVPPKWKHDYGVTENNIFRTFQEDSSLVVSVGFEKIEKYSKMNSHLFIDSYGKEKFTNELEIGFKKQGLNINPKSISVMKSYLHNIESIKIDFTFKRLFEDFSFVISNQQHVFFRNGYKITLTCSSPLTLLESKTIRMEYLNSLFHHLPLK